jgi:GNAT superfamily N-acetyltransferase
MIRFQDISTRDKTTIQQFTLMGERMNCDLSIANILGWRFLYNTQYAVFEDYLIFRFFADGHLAYMTPLPRPKKQPDGSFRVERCDECSASVIRAMREDSIAMGHPFLMLGVCDYMRQVIEEKFPGVLTSKPNRDYADYIYSREKLVTLSGKHLQSKRNHINKFKALYPNYEYRDFTTDLIPECIRLERQWRQSTLDKDEMKENEDLDQELRSMTRIFNRWDELDMRGGTIFIDGKLVAFTFGNPINQTTFDVNVEKADVSYDGAFTIINQEFVKHLPEQYIYINREEDLGDEGLRRAKESYKPLLLLDKSAVTEYHPLRDFLSPEEEKEQTMQLWRNVFREDSEDFVQLYFSKLYKSEYNISCQINKSVVGALQTFPHQFLFHGQHLLSVYISGVSVDDKFRRQNIGTSVMRQAHTYLYEKGVALATLIPAEEWLYGWYGKMGYVTRIAVVPPPAGIAEMPFDEYDRIQCAKPCTVLHDSDYYSVAQEDIRLCGDNYSVPTKTLCGQLRIINAHKVLSAYAVVHPDLETKIHVRADREICRNNAYYVISHGVVTRTDQPLENCIKMTISELATYVFADEQPTMTLMLN